MTSAREKMRTAEDVEDVLHAVADALAFAKGRRQHAERVAHEHEVGHAAGRRAAAFHGDAQVGALEGDHVVHAVADHGHVAAALVQGRRERLFLLRRDAAEDGAVDGGRGELALVEAGELGRPSRR